MNFKDIEGTGLKKILLIKGGNRSNLIFSDLDKLMRKLEDFNYKLEYETPDGFVESWTLDQNKSYKKLLLVKVDLNNSIVDFNLVVEL